MTRPWPLDVTLSAEILPAAEAGALALPWRDLADRALEPNAFFGPDLAPAGLRHLPEGRDASLLAAWRGEGETRRLVGLLPLARPRGRFLNPLPVRRAAALYGTLSTPLLDPDRPAETWAAMLATLGRAGIAALALPFLHQDGPVAAALEEAIGASGSPVVRLDGHRRAFLRSPLPGSEYLRATLESRRRKEADRQRRRLAEEGVLAFEVASAPGDIAHALEAFLTLEKAGWKGRAGTDLLSAPGAAAFIREAALSGAASGRFRIATLTVARRPVAAGLVALSGSRAFYMKTAYDEALARFSPGLLLTLDLTAHLLDDSGIEDADSIAIADHPMIDRLWTERFPVASLLVATAPGGGAAFRAALAFERLRERGVARAKAALVKLRRSSARSGNAAGNKSAAAAPD